MAYQRIHTSLAGGIETITLDYAPTLNALDLVMAGELEEALKEAEGVGAGAYRRRAGFLCRR